MNTFPVHAPREVTRCVTTKENVSMVHVYVTRATVELRVTFPTALETQSVKVGLRNHVYCNWWLEVLFGSVSL